jgi:NADH-quinone oxidoreductase chain G
MIELIIDGKGIRAEPGTSILRAALDNGIYIPNLCYDKRLTHYGGCRLCIVEVKGQRKFNTACTTPVRDGMVVTTESPKIAMARKTLLELLLVHHPLDCPICDKAGECTLQDLAFKYGPSQNRFSAVRKHEPELLEAPIVERNPNRCILCGKCVKICSEHQGAKAINFIGRGFKTKISPAFEETLDCEFCGQCIDICPVGALGSKPYRFRSRVWFMDEYKIVCPYCGCGCTTNISVREGRIVRARGKEDVGINEGDLCSRGRFGFDYIYSENRLTSPLIKKGEKHVKVSWEDAIAHVTKRLNSIREKYGPSAIGAIGSQRCTMEDNFMLQKYMREVIGTDNIDSAARFGYAKVESAIEKVLGLDFLPIRWDAPLKSDFILVIDSDITSTHPVWGINFITAKNRGAQLVVADSKETKLARNSSSWLQINPGSSVALLNGIMRVIIDEELFSLDEELSIGEKAPSTPNFEDLTKSLRDFTPSHVSKITGMSEEEIINLARSYARAKRRMLALTLGSSENTKGMNAIIAAANLVLLMDDRPETLQVPAEFSNTLGMWMVGVRPLKNGKTAFDMCYTPGAVKALYIMGENPLITFKDVTRVEKNLRDLELLIVQDIMYTDTAKIADIVLPGSSWAEKEGTLMAATGIMQELPKLLPETGQSIPDWKVFRNLARIMNEDMPISYSYHMGMMEYGQVRAAIQDMISPMLTKCGVCISSPAFHPVIHELSETRDSDYPLLFVTENLFQHSGALSILSKNLGSMVSDAFLQINPADASKYKVVDDAFVKVASRRGEIFLKAMLTAEVPEGTVFAPVHFPHARINTLTHLPSDGEAPTDVVKVEPA